MEYYQKALKIYEDAGDFYKASSTLTKLGGVLEAQENWTEATTIYIRALAIDLEHNNEDWVNSDLKDLGRMLQQLGEHQLKAVWREARSEEIPEELYLALLNFTEGENSGRSQSNYPQS